VVGSGALTDLSTSLPAVEVLAAAIHSAVFLVATRLVASQVVTEVAEATDKNARK
jgi:hypothetical protein